MNVPILRRRLAVILLFLILLPYALAVVYPLMHPPSTLMVADWLRLNKTSRDWVPLSGISPNLINAVMIAEDDMFCAHHGINVRQMQKSIKQAEARGRPIKATSTITQQLAKNLFLWHGRSWLRLDFIWSKPQILETYLNIVEWGDDIYGAEAATQHYFHTSAKNLSHMQAALLATTLPNPEKRNATSPGPAQAVMAAGIAARLASDAPDLTCLD